MNDLEKITEMIEDITLTFKKWRKKAICLKKLKAKGIKLSDWENDLIDDYDDGKL